MKIGIRLRAVAAAAAVTLTLVAAGCGGGGGGTEASPGAAGSQSAATENANLAITFVPKNLGNPYFDTSNKGGQEAIKEFGGKFRRGRPCRGKS